MVYDILVVREGGTVAYMSRPTTWVVISALAVGTKPDVKSSKLLQLFLRVILKSEVMEAIIHMTWNRRIGEWVRRIRE
jgi:hypothetical protein